MIITNLDKNVSYLITNAWLMALVIGILITDKEENKKYALAAIAIFTLIAFVMNTIVCLTYFSQK